MYMYMYIIGDTNRDLYCAVRSSVVSDTSTRISQIHVEYNNYLFPIQKMTNIKERLSVSKWLDKAAFFHFSFQN